MIRANSLDRRMARLERRLRPPRGLFFLAWGRDRDEIEAALTQSGQVWPDRGWRHCRASDLAGRQADAAVSLDRG